jgi:hypothetical protein
MKTRWHTIRRVLSLVKEGHTLSSSIKSTGLSRNTWYIWEKKSERLKNLREKCVEVSDERRLSIVEDSLLKACQEGNVTAMIFFLTNRASKRWADKRAVINNSIVNKVGGTNGTFDGEDRDLQSRIRTDLETLFGK